MGTDISSLKKSENKGGIYFDENGNQGDALKILHDYSLNYARIRVWVDSPNGYHGKAQLLEMAERLKVQSIKLLVDYHYADSWVDPGKQPRPKTWETLDFKGLKKALYDHIFDICNSLKAQGTPPDMVQVGNEITNGMLWLNGKNDQSFDNLVALLKEGVRAQNNLDDIAVCYNKDIVVVEMAYAFTPDDNDNYKNIINVQERPGYPFTSEGQTKILAIMTILRAIPNGHGLGIFWWDATWTAVPMAGILSIHPLGITEL